MSNYIFCFILRFDLFGKQSNGMKQEEIEEKRRVQVAIPFYYAMDRNLSSLSSFGHCI